MQRPQQASECAAEAEARWGRRDSAWRMKQAGVVASMLPRGEGKSGVMALLGRWQKSVGGRREGLRFKASLSVACELVRVRCACSAKE